MRLRRIALENVRSFLDRAELHLDGNMAIIIGPNGGGKTNLLDAAVIALRKFLFSSMSVEHIPTAENPYRSQFSQNNAINNLVLEPHSSGAGRQQLVEIEVEVTARDVENMRAMKDGVANLEMLAQKKYTNLNVLTAKNWDLTKISAGHRFTYRIVNNVLQSADDPVAAVFLNYLRQFEIDSYLRDEYGLAPLSMPILYLPVNRAANAFQSTVQLSSFNEHEQRKQVHATSSRHGASIVSLAVGMLARKYRLLQEDNNTSAKEKFRQDKNLVALTKLLKGLGYDWNLETRNAMTNEYDVRLSKQGSSFLVGAASSGERELLTYLFAIYALNVRDALIIVDEPELHLHPKWQKTLLALFTDLSKETGNQFLLATHSPTFVSPESIQFVSRVYSREQKSHIVRLNSASLPEARHLFNIVNSQNNERIFFADKVILVEGLSDRMFFEAVFQRLGYGSATRKTFEVVSVGGKGLFASYRSVLSACQVDVAIIADRDYIEQIGSDGVKSLFSTNFREIKDDVVENIKSRDGESLVKAIDEAIRSGTWEHAKETWEYIKGHRRELRDDIDAHGKELLSNFVLEKRKQGVCVLSRGALESYLPSGYKSKDIDKLIRFLNEGDFLGRIEVEAREELEAIAAEVLADCHFEQKEPESTVAA